MKLAIGIVVKNGKQFIEQWIESAERVGCIILVIDNDADPEVREKLINHKQVKQYHIQHNMGRNMSRDYQKILDMGREENATWIWNIDIDEVVPEFDVKQFAFYLANTTDDCVGFPMFEMRNDNEHYIMIEDGVNTPKHARIGHKLYKVLSHFEFNLKDYHGCAIPPNCKPGKVINTPLQHFGHYTKEMRDLKRNCYTEDPADKAELSGSWMKEDKDVIIKKWDDWKK